MDQRPIGVFDSGLGGLTTVRELARRLPNEQIIYFGDTGRVPYGGRSRETIIKYAHQDVRFLNSFDLKALVIACGTVSAAAIHQLRKEEQPIPVFGVVEPTAAHAAQVTKNGRVGLIATKATIRSGAYEKIMKEHRPELEIFPQACPLFVPLVENGRTQPGDIVIETVVQDYLSTIKEKNVDTLVLGCTHYPLLSQVIGSYMGPSVTLLDSGAEVVRQLQHWLTSHDQLADPTRPGSCRWYVSDSTASFRELAGQFLGRPVTEPVEQIAIENY